MTSLHSVDEESTPRTLDDAQEHTADNGAAEAAEPAEDHDDEAFEQRTQAHIRVDRGNGREHGGGECRQRRREPESERIDRENVDAVKLRRVEVLRGRAQRQAEPGVLEDEPQRHHRDAGHAQDQ